jgi:hypothetical protein
VCVGVCVCVVRVRGHGRGACAWCVCGVCVCVVRVRCVRGVCVCACARWSLLASTGGQTRSDDIRTLISKHKISVMVAVYRTPFAIPCHKQQQ